MRDTFLSFSPPFLGEEEIAEVVETLRSDWITTGPRTRLFEQRFAEFVGAPAALAVNSCTDAMLVGLASLGIGPGDEVITTTMTFCSTVNVIECLGARPVLVDVEPDTLNLDARQIQQAITPRTRAVLPVHLYGHPCDMDALIETAGTHGIEILEDAAHALPARYRGRMIGANGNLTAFSFYATKNLTTAEGGMLTGEEKLIQKARLWSLHGMDRDAYRRYDQEGSWRYEVVLPGFKCNMTDIQAALGLHQLHKLPTFQRRRKQIASRYDGAFSCCPELKIPTQRDEVESALHLYCLRLELDRLKIDRARFIQELKNRNIGSSVHFIPIHIQPYYRDKYGYKPDDFPAAYRNYLRLVTLPLNLRMSDADVEDVIQTVKQVVEGHRL